MKYNYFFYVFLFVLFVSCNSTSSKLIIAKYDSGIVNLEDVIDSYRILSDSDKSKIKTKDEYFRFVRKVALEKIIIDNATKDGLLNDATFMSKLEEAKTNASYDILKKKNVLDKINITEADYNKYKKIYEVYQIVKRNDILDTNKLEQSKKFLTKLSKEIKDLASFKEAAKKYSDDVTGASEGFVGKIRLGIMEEEIDKALENISIGKVSGVVESSVGYHIIFVNSIEQISFDDLLKDKNLYDMIYKQKEEKLENDWYDSLLKNPALKIDKKEMKSKKEDDTPIITYKDKTITRKEVLKTVDNLRQGGAFPEPTEEELYSLVKNMGLNLILQDMVKNESSDGSKDFKEKLEKERKFLIINEYLDKHVKMADIKDEDIKKFYDENINTLFTFKMDDGKIYTQDMEEVKKFIMQKLESKYIQDARYDLYRKLVDEAHLNIDDKILSVLIEKINKK
ncbi:MAG: hypothetical protein A2086_00610 [Spirochaetes bacterium GWD1_27_9]|nr:MAG: hypothetical protein A2Z98_05120 [Spirochaetes bacterium GWB1_27_13]OHD25040.1 MAG: hypothetical protein A2Y34_03175 [Spirochaetes bacterium GWC1_27_15]OHD32511.1 MAG: hypothetical protein A2086_00610 [Spirochaetes bacterium GWD1_27_9]